MQSVNDPTKCSRVTFGAWVSSGRMKLLSAQGMHCYKLKDANVRIISLVLALRALQTNVDFVCFVMFQGLKLQICMKHVAVLSLAPCK